MINYQKLIKNNSEQFKDEDELIDFIDNYINEDQSNLTDLEDSIAEQADSNCPIYYNDIVEQWRKNSDCHGVAVEVCGEYGSKDDIYKMMQEDLYFYYEQRLREDYNVLLELLEEQVDETEELTEDLQREALTEAGIPEDEAERMIEDIKA